MPAALAPAMSVRRLSPTISTEAETALALQGLGSYPILQSGSPATV